MSASFIQRGGLWVVVQFVLMIAVIVFGVVLRGNNWGTPLVALGIALFVLGAIFGIAGALVLGRNRTAFPRPRMNSELIQHGIYAHVRHPLYTSVMLISLGWALVWQSVSALVTALVLIPFFHAKARHEERWLCEKFPGYADYLKRVPRFLPRFRIGGQYFCNF
jgi:protein-S-isoprenylcysteine O-methyltransferase Ste14